MVKKRRIGPMAPAWVCPITPAWVRLMAPAWVGLIAFVILIFSGSSVVRASQKTSLSSIEKNYHGARILKVIHYQKRYVMIEYQYPTTANHFDLYDLATGKRYSLPLGAEYTTLSKIVNQNELVFDATGTNSEVPQNRFPFVMVCKRKNAGAEFGLTEYPKYLNVNQGFKFKNGKTEALTSYGFTQNGIEFQFGPQTNESPAAFYAGSTWIPTTQFSYNRHKNQLTLRFLETSISSNFEVTNDPMSYIKSVSLHQSAQTGTSVVLQLKPGTQYYNANVTWEDGQHHIPELQISFLPKNVTFQPGMVIFHDASGGQVDHFLQPILAEAMPAPSSSPTDGTPALPTTPPPLYTVPSVIRRDVLVTATFYRDRHMSTISTGVSLHLVTQHSQKLYFVELDGLFYQDSLQPPAAVKLKFYIPVNGSSIQNLKAYDAHDRMVWQIKELPVQNWAVVFRGHSAHWEGEIVERVSEIRTQREDVLWSDELEKVIYLGTGTHKEPKVSYTIAYDTGGNGGSRENVILKHGFTISSEAGGNGAPILKDSVCHATVKWSGHTESFEMKST
ncbi:MAG: hypothetical protein K6T83_01820 [Alicyclobacillus sp.]|nr:hypothetical protein [Alicyclobacillus sp.]